MREKLVSERIRTCDPYNPRRRTSCLVTKDRRDTNPVPNSFILAVCMILKPQVCIVSNIHVHILSRYTHSEVVKYRHANSRVLLTCLTAHL